jgi:hypothetical protein
MDKKALQILFQTYWSPAGWRDEHQRAADPEDFRHAKQAGVMFDPIDLTHDRVVKWLLEVRAKIQANEVADAFLASLTTRRLDLRSALGSYSVIRHFPDHTHRGGRGACSICGAYDPRGTEAEDLNILNFERFKWGGVRHDQAVYAAFDLERFMASERPEPTEEDKVVLRSILDMIEGVAAAVTAPQLQGKLSGLFKSNKAEREVVLNILGFCGILRTPGHSGYWDDFVPYANRELPSQRFVDMAYPTCWWHGRDGLDRDAVRRVFPTL